MVIMGAGGGHTLVCIKSMLFQNYFLFPIKQFKYLLTPKTLFINIKQHCIILNTGNFYNSLFFTATLK